MAKKPNIMLLIFKVVISAIAVSVFSYSLLIYDPASISKNMNEFYKQGFSTIVISSNIYMSKSTEFHLKNGLKVYLMLPADDEIMIGDSVQKQPNTYFYKVFRKNGNNYDLFGINNFKDYYLNHKVK
jgi:hypothetical protein